VLGSVGNTVTMGPFRFYALLDFKSRYIENLTTEMERCAGLLGAGLCRANYYPNDYNVLYDAETSALAFGQNYVDQYYQSGAFLKLREVSATYTIPARLVRGFSRSSFTLAAREIHTWTSWRGIDPEAFNGTLDQAVLPPLMRIIGTVNLAW
jgi:hypothetical protein